MNTEELLDLKQRIDETKTAIAKQQGELGMMYSRLDKEYHVDSLDEAEAFLESEKRGTASLDKELSIKIEQVKRRLEKIDGYQRTQESD